MIPNKWGICLAPHGIAVHVLGPVRHHAGGVRAKRWNGIEIPKMRSLADDLSKSKTVIRVSRLRLATGIPTRGRIGNAEGSWFARLDVHPLWWAIKDYNTLPELLPIIQRCSESDSEGLRRIVRSVLER
jgi:hypothetical protein